MVNYFPTFVLQNSSALWALLALSVPLILHFFSKQKATLIKFANITLISELKVKSSHKLRITDVWLLLLRLLLLLVSVFLLAKVSLAPSVLEHDEIYLISPDWLYHSNQDERAQLVAMSANKPVFLLGQARVAISPDEILTWKQQTGDDGPQNIASALNAFTASLAAKTTVKLFVTNRANQYKVNNKKQPITAVNHIDWHIKKLAFEPQKQYQDAIKVMIIYDQDRFADLKYFQRAFELIKQHVAPRLSLTSFLNVDLLNIDAYQQKLADKPQWLFYFSSKAMDENMLNAIASGTHVLVDANKFALNLMADTRLTIDKNTSDLLGSDVIFYRRVQPVMLFEQLKSHILSQSDVSKTDVLKADEVVWQFTQKSGERLALLTKSSLRFSTQNHNEAEHSTEIYQLHSRFSSEWSNLLVTQQLPLLLKNLLLSSWVNLQAQTQQTLNEQQISQAMTPFAVSLPRTTEADTASLKNSITGKAQAMNTTEITELLTVILLLLLITERIVSELNSKPKLKASVAGEKSHHKDNMNASSINATKVID